MGASLKEWIEQMGGGGGIEMVSIGFWPFLVVMLISLASSLFISYLYVKFYKTRATGSQVHRAFALLGISITAVFICIQFSLPLSLGLLGALSIVRFRTPIKEPEEIGFIMLVVASLLCCATFSLLFLGVLLVVAVVAMLIMNAGRGWLHGSVSDGMLTVMLDHNEYQKKASALIKLLEETLPKGRVDSMVNNENGCAVSYSFVKLESDVLIQLQSDVKKTVSSAKVNVFFNRSGDV